MPWECRKLPNGEWGRFKVGTNEKVSTHESFTMCKAAIRAAYANEPKNENTLYLRGEVGKDFDVELVRDALEEADKEQPFKVYINSPGGNAFTAIDIFNLLTSYEGEVHTYVETMAMSAAATIMLAGDKIFANRNSIIMIHGPRIDPKKFGGTEEELRDALNAVKAAKEQLSQTLQARTGKSAEVIGKILGKNSWYPAPKAKDAGLIDELLEIAPRKKMELYNISEVPDEIVAFVELSNVEVEIMSYKDICSAFEIDIKDVEDKDLESKITEFIESLTSKVKEHEETITNITTELEDTKKRIPKPKHELPGSLLKLYVSTRENEINSLVHEGKITAAVASGFKKTFCNPEVLKFAVDEDGNIQDNYEGTIESVRKNEVVLSFKGKTGTQPLFDNNASTNPVLADVERRRKEAGLSN